jgi:hypothetical protein
MRIYSEFLLLLNRLECVEIAAPTSQLYALSTVMRMITEYHLLCRYAALRWHNVPTKNREYQCSSSLHGVEECTNESVTTWH